ncbi:MAG: polysaccharide deacetylase family protein [Kiritimatiellia bacterium]
MMKVVQCWDDGVNDDIRLIEILRKHGAKASFNLNPATHRSTRQGDFSERFGKRIERLARPELNAVYDGFTIANHTMSHPRPLEIALEEWRGEVFDARKQLQDWFQQPIHGFVYPYGGNDAATAAVVREAGHCYGRTTANATPCVPSADPMRQPADCHFLSDKFQDRYDLAKASGCGVFYFWGHSFELCRNEQWTAFEAVIKGIKDDPESEWAELTDVFPPVT